MARICPRCNTENAYGIWDCRNCGADLRNVNPGAISSQTPVEQKINVGNKLSGHLVSSTPQEPIVYTPKTSSPDEHRMSSKNNQYVLDIFEPLVDWDENIVAVTILRDASNCLYFFLFRLFAPFVTRNYYVALTDKRMLVIRIPRSGLFEYKKHFSVEYGEVSIDLFGYNEVIGIKLLNPPKSLTLKFPVFTKLETKEEFISKIRDYSVSVLVHPVKS